MLYPLDDFLALLPNSTTFPSARTTSISSTQSPTFPYFTVCIPPALFATMPPIVEMLPDDGKGGKNIPCRSISSLTTLP